MEEGEVKDLRDADRHAIGEVSTSTTATVDNYVALEGEDDTTNCSRHAAPLFVRR